MLNLDNPGIIINQLEASTLLAGTWILKDIEKAKNSLTYKEDEATYSYPAYYRVLLDEVDQIPTIELSPVVTPGTSRAYLIDLTTGLEAVMDHIEVVHNKTLFFLAKIRAAKTHLGNLNNSFKAWYLIAMQKELQRFEIKLPAKALDALAESEFNRLVDGVQDDLDGLEDVLTMLVDRLKSRKRLAQDKYKLGQDQANMSLLPQLGAQAGYNENQTGAALLKERYGLGMDLERPNMVLDEPDPSLLKKKKKKPTPLVDEFEEALPEEPTIPVETVFEGCWMTPVEPGQTFTVKEEVGAMVFNSQAVIPTEPPVEEDYTVTLVYDTPWEEIGEAPAEVLGIPEEVVMLDEVEGYQEERVDIMAPWKEAVQDGMKSLQEAEDDALQALLKEAAECGLEISVPVNETPVTSNVKGKTETAAPARARRKVFQNEEAESVQPAPSPAVEEVVTEEPPPQPITISVKKRRIAYED